MNIKLKYAGLVAAGLGAGFGIGYFAAMRRATKGFNKAVEEIRADWIDDIHRANKTGPYATPESAVAELHPETGPLEHEQPLEDPGVIDEYDSADPKPTESDDDDPENQVDVKGIIEKFKSQTVPYGGVTFPGQVDDVDADADIPVPSVPSFTTVRDPNGPYVISIDEYMESESPYSKLELTYFEGDETLIDSSEQIVPNPKQVLGELFDQKWGQGTTDENQVYIRDERQENDYEVTRDDRTYTRVVLNIIPEDEMKRMMTKPLKMRESDGD